MDCLFVCLASDYLESLRNFTQATVHRRQEAKNRDPLIMFVVFSSIRWQFSVTSFESNTSEMEAKNTENLLRLLAGNFSSLENIYLVLKIPFLYSFSSIPQILIHGVLLILGILSFSSLFFFNTRNQTWVLGGLGI